MSGADSRQRQTDSSTRKTDIPHSCPDITDVEIEMLLASARSLQVGAGDRVTSLEQRIAADLGYRYGLATVNGGQSIHLALRGLFPAGGAAVGLPSYVCRAVYDAICLAGCRPVLLDIDAASFSVSLEAARRQPLDAVVVPHMFGIRAAVEQFLDEGFMIIEDCAQRLVPLDQCRREPRGHLRVLSFAATKLLTGGEGGMLLGDDEQLCERVRKLRDAPYDFPEPAVWLPYSDLQAALVQAQWERLSGFLEMRSRHAVYYLAALEALCPECIVPAMRDPDTFHFRFLLRVDDPEALIRFGAERGIAFRRPVAPVGLHTLFQAPGDFSASDDALAHLVSLPIYPRLRRSQAEEVVNVIKESFG